MPLWVGYLRFLGNGLYLNQKIEPRISVVNADFRTHSCDEGVSD